ncbi:MAG: asparagine synthetase B [Candidatus Wallbacteria bacterium]|nr:asparagine synthetase B [Candidatus Wallbacteria bacterium]
MRITESINKLIFCCLLFYACAHAESGKILVPMDSGQSNHLRAYGLTYACLKQGDTAKWLLNYRGGSFLLPNQQSLAEMALKWGITCQIVDSAAEALIYKEISDNNMESIHLEKSPKIAVYTPESAKPWDDAVTLALDYAQIPYTKIYDQDIIAGRLSEFDWLHLHHEDFTSQYSKFYTAFRNAEWYQESVFQATKLAHDLGFQSVADEKKAVAGKIAGFVDQGGLLFAMCYSTETLDIALAADGIDIVPPEIDGTPVTQDFNSKLDYTKTLAFEGFTVNPDPQTGYISDIDYNHANTPERIMARPFSLFDFSAKFDPIPCLLTQCHERVIKGFFGLTTSYTTPRVKKGTTILGKVDDNCVKYIYGKFGKGSFTFYAGHDPEDYSHAVYDKFTDLSQHPDSPGYRLILNNVLFPAAEKKKLKT